MSDPRGSTFFKPLSSLGFVGHPTYQPNQTCNATPWSTGPWIDCAYTASAVLFIMSLKGLSNQETATWGCIYGVLGMVVAVLSSWLSAYVCDDGVWLSFVAMVPGILLGAGMAMKVQMIEMPQLVGLLNAFGGLASAVEAIGVFLDKHADEKMYVEKFDVANGGATVTPVLKSEDGDWSNGKKYLIVQSAALHMALIVGSVTFFGSVVACLKLMGKVKDFVPKMRNVLNLVTMGGALVCCVIAEEVYGYGDTAGVFFLILAFLLSAAWGILFVMAIGGADMPVVICILNTGSGLAGVFAGFMLGNKLLVITGTFVASSGMILSALMCVAMNRNLISVLGGGFGSAGGSAAKGAAKKFEGEMKEIKTDDLAPIFNSAKKIIIVPGYGMAAGKAQHKVAELVTLLRGRGINVRFAIHPVAGRLPGHMNVLLAEARVPYDVVLSMDEINHEFPETDVVLVLGANDIVNPAAEEDPNCAIAGMPVLQVWKAKKTFVVKRGQGSGYSGVDNPLFIRDNNHMYYGNALKQMDDLCQAVAKLEAVGGAKSLAAGGARVEEIKVELALSPPEAPGITVGVLTENSDSWEKRVALVPSVVRQLTNGNYKCVLQSGCGKASGFLDEDYVSAGAVLVDNRNQVIQSAQMLISVTPPQELKSGDSSLKDKWVVSWIGKMTPEGQELLKTAASAGINVIDVTSVPRITIAQKLDVLSSQAKIAGHRAVLESAVLYGRFFAPEITAAGKFPPANVMVLGAGVAGLAAIGTAVSLGAQVRAWDVRNVSDQVESMGGKWITVDFEEKGDGGGGYAKESSEAFQQAQKATFAKHAKECDIIITTAAIPGRASPLLLEESMLSDMKPGSVIIDLAAMGGGNCAATKKGETYLWNGRVTICGDLDFPSKMKQQASMMYANNMWNLLDHVAKAADSKEGGSASVLPNLVASQKKELEEVVCTQIVCAYNGEVVKAPPPPMPTAPPVVKSDANSGKKEKIAKVSTFGDSFVTTHQFAILMFCILMFLIALLDNEILIELMLVFTLSAWIGYMLVYGVHPALHTPLMSVSNAISGQVILGGIFMVSSKESGVSVCGALAIFIASMNVAGGFVVTAKMLKMYVKEK